MAEVPEGPERALSPYGADDPADLASVDLLAAALRADAAEVGTLVRVLTATLGDTLPAGMVEVQRERSLADRLSGRDGTVVAVTVTTPDRRLRLAAGRHRGTPEAEVQRVVRGVVISRQDVGVDQWVRALAEVLAVRAQADAAAREALGRLLRG